MSTSTLDITTWRENTMTRAADYLELTKPRIATMVLVTVCMAAFVAHWGTPPLGILVNTLIGTALVASSASAFNQLLERHTDALMARTANRPLPAGRLSVAEVITFGSVTIVAGLAYLTWTVNLTTAVLGFLTWAMYVWIYTPLKTMHPVNTFVGAIAGALPMLMGCSAVDGLPLAIFDVNTANATMLFLILFLWQFPHFMAIAWIYRKDYAQADLKMLPVVDPSGGRAGAQAVLCALALIPVSLIPYALHMAGPWYIFGATTLGLIYAYRSIVFCRQRNEVNARALLRASLYYLPLLMGFLMLLVIYRGRV